MWVGTYSLQSFKYSGWQNLVCLQPLLPGSLRYSPARRKEKVEDGTCEVQTWKDHAHYNEASYVCTPNQNGNENTQETIHDEWIRNPKQSVEQNKIKMLWEQVWKRPVEAWGSPLVYYLQFLVHSCIFHSQTFIKLPVYTYLFACFMCTPECMYVHHMPTETRRRYQSFCNSVTCDWAHYVCWTQTPVLSKYS